MFLILSSSLKYISSTLLSSLLDVCLGIAPLLEVLVLAVTGEVLIFNGVGFGIFGCCSTNDGGICGSILNNDGICGGGTRFFS